MIHTWHPVLPTQIAIKLVADKMAGNEQRWQELAHDHQNFHDLSSDKSSTERKLKNMDQIEKDGITNMR